MLVTGEPFIGDQLGLEDVGRVQVINQSTPHALCFLADYLFLTNILIVALSKAHEHRQRWWKKRGFDREDFRATLVAARDSALSTSSTSQETFTRI